MSQRRIADHGNLAQAEVTRVRGKFRQSDLAIQAAAAVFLKHANRDPAVSHAGLIDECGSERLGKADYQVLSAPGNVGSETRHADRGDERLEKPPVVET